MSGKRIAVPDRTSCAACGSCMDVCPRGAITVWRGSYAIVDAARCVGCGLCGRACPAGVIAMEVRPFRLAFMTFFFAMFFDILYTTWVVAQGAGDWQTVFAFRLYRFMLTSEIIAIASMLCFRPRSWCVYCPMGTLTQLICQRKARGGAVEMKEAMEK